MTEDTQRCSSWKVKWQRSCVRQNKDLLRSEITCEGEIWGVEVAACVESKLPLRALTVEQAEIFLPAAYEGEQLPTIKLNIRDLKSQKIAKRNLVENQ